MRVVRAEPGDEGVVRAIRLRALLDAPLAFDGILAVEAGWTHERWSVWLHARTVFLLENDGRTVGLACGDPDEADDAAAFLGAMWVDPAYRGRGGSDALIAAVRAWARSEGRRQLRLHVVADDEHARHCYERNGFRFTGESIRRTRDGVRELEMLCTA